MWPHDFAALRRVPSYVAPAGSRKTRRPGHPTAAGGRVGPLVATVTGRHHAAASQARQNRLLHSRSESVESVASVESVESVEESVESVGESVKSVAESVEPVGE